MGSVKGPLANDVIYRSDIEEKTFLGPIGTSFHPGPTVKYAEYVLLEAIADYKSKLSQLSQEVQEPNVSRGTKLEEVVAQLFKKMGFEDVLISGGASDKGVDVECYKKEGEGTKYVIVQCKNQSLLNKVKPAQVRDFAHVLEREQEKQHTLGYFITSSYFSPECYLEENCGRDMELIDRDHLEKLLSKCGMSLDSLEQT